MTNRGEQGMKTVADNLRLMHGSKVEGFTDEELFRRYNEFLACDYAGDFVEYLGEEKV